MAEISTNQVGFQNLKYTLTALPVLAYLKLDGFSSDGVQWDRPQSASVRIGADGKAVVNSRPVLYSGTFGLLPTSNARVALDNLINAAVPKFGKDLVDYSIVLTVENETTGSKTIYSGGVIEEFDGGDSANLDDGQGNKSYKLTFTDRVILPL